MSPADVSSRRLKLHRPVARAVCAVLAVATAVATGGLATPSHASAAGYASIRVNPVRQKYGLDCEAAALQIALSAIGINVSQDWLLQRFGVDPRLPAMSGGRPVRWGDPYESFVGDVRGAWLRTGYGVYYPPIAAAAQVAGAGAVGHEAWSPSQLYNEVALGHPVVVRVSHLLNPVSVGHWTAWDGRNVWYSPQDHAQVLSGFNYAAGTVTLADPSDGQMHTVSMSLFEYRFAQFMGSAVVITPPGIHLAPLQTTGQASSAIAVASGTIWALSPGAGSFGSNHQWSSVPFYGTRATTFADLDGPGKPASAVAINEASVWVMKNNNGSFGYPTPWSSVPFYGSRATLMADVDGSGFAAAVAINDNSVWVMRVNSARDGFGAPQLWSSSFFYGNRATVMADVDGSGRASPVAVNDDSIWVLPNHGGASFDPPQSRSSSLFYGSRGTFMADLDGPGKPASAVAMNDSSIWVEKNNGAGSFTAPVPWSSGPFYANSQYLADLDGSGRASAIAVSSTAIWVEQNTGSGFGPPTRWFDGAFYGTH
jgi:uncharacterized protein YvpB